MSTSGQADLAGGGGLADREALGEVVQADADGDEEGERPARRQPLTVLHLDSGHRPGSHHGGRPAPRHEPLPVDEPEQSDGQAGGEQEAEREDPAPGALLGCGGRKRGLYRLDCGRKHVPEEEEQDPRRGGAQEGLETDGRVAQTADGQAEEDGEPGERAKQQDLVRGHEERLPFCSLLGRPN